MKSLSSWLFILLAAVSSTQIPSQSPITSNFQFCATSKYMKQALSKNSTWKQSLDDANQDWIGYSLSNVKSARLPYSFIEIPINWHALNIPNDENSFISDGSIAFQVRELNLDFTGLNWNYDSGTPEEFRHLRCGQSGITFRLNTVVRKSITTAFDQVYNESIRNTTASGSDPVDPAKSLNIWTAPIEENLSHPLKAGMATYPGSPLEADGVVLHPLVIITGLGRIVTHEIGHWLGLEHVWGDNNNCFNVESISDYVLDTPAQRRPNYKCPPRGKIIKSCHVTIVNRTQINPDFNPYSQDMYMNFMDLTDDECKSMFTLGQCDRMWYFIQTMRMGLLPNNLRREVSDISFVSWLYFRRLESFDDIEDNICFEDDHILFYNNNLHNRTSSNISIFGCLVKTKNMRISHIIDIYIMYGNGGCNDGYTQSSQDLNEGNNGSSIYLCYLKEDSTEDNENMAVLDIALIGRNDLSKLDMNKGWEVNVGDIIGSNNVTLNLAIELGQYFIIQEDEARLLMTKGGILCVSLSSIALILIICIVTGITKRNRKTLQSSLSINEYGSIIEISENINVEL